MLVGALPAVPVDPVICNLPGAGTGGGESVNLSGSESSQTLAPNAPGEQRDTLEVRKGQTALI